jgi:probable rRNA maturation factor
MNTIDIRNFTRSTPAARVPFAKIAEQVLPGWDISLVFAGERRAQQLNRALRNKEYIPNVLSYVSGKKSGEIIICPRVAERQAPEYELPVPEFIAYLFIHGLLHLKGLPHGATIDKYEREHMTRFGYRIPSHLNDTTHRHRH